MNSFAPFHTLARLLFWAVLLVLSSGLVIAQDAPSNTPSPDTIAALLATDDPIALHRIDEGVPGWTATRNGQLIAYLGSTWEISGSLGYSGRPLDVLIAISPKGRFVGAHLVRHSEPVLTLGISDADITAYVEGFIGLDLVSENAQRLDDQLPDIISRATVTTAVLRDSILRSARALAVGRGILSGGGVDRVAHQPASWADLLAMGALTETRVTMADAARALADAKVPIPPSDKPFLHLRTGVIDTPTAGASLLGPKEFSRVMGSLGPQEAVLAVMSSGLYSHRGTDWRQTGLFDRIAIRQGNQLWQPTAEDYRMIRKLPIDGAPELKEISLFTLPPRIDATAPFTVEVLASRPTVSGDEIDMRIALPFELPEAFRAAPPEASPLWRRAWEEKRPQTIFVAAMLTALAGILFAQEAITRRPRLWRGLRLGFLTVTFLGLGLGLNGQLSVVQVMAFLNSLLSGFHWETFLVEPVIFMLWSFTALGLLFWGRGVYCGWLCPFGALQELMNSAARKLGIRQVAVPQALHERLWAIKYTLFVAIVALSFYSMHDALILAEAEPFKTAISMRFMRAWPFLLFVVAILVMGLFIERFYCRYLCPLGAGLAIPAKLKVFDWLHRRPQCGRECRLCETQCTVGAIDAIGRINPNECVLCLRCQVTMTDPAQCPILKRRARQS